MQEGAYPRGKGAPSFITQPGRALHGAACPELPPLPSSWPAHWPWDPQLLQVRGTETIWGLMELSSCGWASIGSHCRSSGAKPTPWGAVSSALDSCSGKEIHVTMSSCPQYVKSSNKSITKVFSKGSYGYHHHHCHCC